MIEGFATMRYKQFINRNNIQFNHEYRNEDNDNKYKITEYYRNEITSDNRKILSYDTFEWLYVKLDEKYNKCNEMVIKSDINDDYGEIYFIENLDNEELKLISKIDIDFDMNKYKEFGKERKKYLLVKFEKEKQ